MLLRMVCAALCFGKLFLRRGGRDGGSEGGTEEEEGVREEGREEGGREGEREGERKGGREKGREGARVVGSLSAGNGGEGDSGVVFVLCESETIFDGLLQVGHSVGAVPLGTVNVDHLLTWKLIT